MTRLFSPQVKNKKKGTLNKASLFKIAAESIQKCDNLDEAENREAEIVTPSCSHSLAKQLDLNVKTLPNDFKEETILVLTNNEFLFSTNNHESEILDNKPSLVVSLSQIERKPVKKSHFQRKPLKVLDPSVSYRGQIPTNMILKPPESLEIEKMQIQM